MYNSLNYHVLFRLFFFSGFREDLLPMADIVTPNLKEASALLGGMRLETVDDMRSAAKSIYDMGPRLVPWKMFYQFIYFHFY